MHKITSKSELCNCLKNNNKKIIISNSKIVSNIKPLSNIEISLTNRNRCNYTLENKIDDSAFLGFIGFAPMISEIANVSFLKSMGIISCIGLHEVLIILSHYNISYKNNLIILTKL